MELNAEWEDIIRKEQDIYIFGAGKYGREILKLLQRSSRGERVKKFIVSTEKGNSPFIQGIPVGKISDDDDRKCPVLISVSDKYQEEARQYLTENGFANVIVAYKFSFLNEEYDSKVEVVSIKELLEAQYIDGEYNRYDIVPRVLAVEEYYGRGAKRVRGWFLYRKMQSHRIYEGYEDKSEKRFRELIASWDCDGYQPDSEILVDESYRLVDGMHRLSLAVFHGLSFVKIRVIRYEEVALYGRQWFRQYFTADECDLLQKGMKKILEGYHNWKMGEKELKEKIRIMLGDNPVFGKGGFYQSLPRLNLYGQRPTGERIAWYGLKSMARGKNIIDIGCNCGFLDMEISSEAKHIDGIEHDATLVNIANEVKNFLHITNVNFIRADFNDFVKEKRYDMVLSFAVHYWIGMGEDEYASCLDEMLVEGGIVVFESQDIQNPREKFREYCESFKRIGYKRISEGDIFDDGKIRRRYVVLKKYKMKLNDEKCVGQARHTRHGG